MTYTEKLPPLPEPAYVSHDIPLFSSMQMMAYAQAALDALQADKPKTIAEWWAAKQAASAEPVAWTYTGIKVDGSEHGPHLVWSPAYMDAMSASKGAKATPLYTTAQPSPAPAQPAVSGEPDMKHPKIQALIGGKARREIELQIVEQLLDDPDCDLSAMDMEYWHGLHDKLREKLLAAQPMPARVPLTDAQIDAVTLTQHERWNRAGREPYKFHPQASHVDPNYRDGWNAALDAAAAHTQIEPLTDEQIDQITAEQWGRGLGAPYAAYRAYARAIEAAHGIVPAPTTDQSHPQR